MNKGIDLSKHNGNIDWQKVGTSDVTYVILRAGYGKEIKQKDPTFETNYKGAKSIGLPVGVYWYSYADSVENAKTEAKVCLEAIKGKQFEYPIYFDLEEKSQFDKGKAFCDSLVRAFCGEIEKAGYFTGLYCSTYWLSNFISKEVSDRYAIWVAQYGSKCTYNVSPYGMWQYSSTGKIPGINGNVDLDYCYVDYPKSIKAKGLNGIGKNDKPVFNTVQPTQKPTQVQNKKTVDEIAKEVIAGKWGVGQDRKNKLAAAGYDYGTVQKRVNELLK